MGGLFGQIQQEPCHGAQLRAARVLAGPTQRTLGAVLGVDERAVRFWERTRFLWAVPLPTPDGRENAWHKTARDAAGMAETGWVRMAANMGAGCYDVYETPQGLSEPDWPEDSLSELLRVAFGANRLINTVDHPILNRLRGL